MQMKPWSLLKASAAESKRAQLLAAIPFALCIALDLAFGLTYSAPRWVNWIAGAYTLAVISFFQKQVEQLGARMILWTVLGLTVLLILGACMQWGHLYSLLPLGVLVTQLEMVLLLPRKGEDNSDGALPRDDAESPPAEGND